MNEACDDMYSSADPDEYVRIGYVCIISDETRKTPALAESLQFTQHGSNLHVKLKALPDITRSFHFILPSDKVSLWQYKVKLSQKHFIQLTFT